MAHLTNLILAIWNELRTPYGFMRFRVMLAMGVLAWSAAVGVLFYRYGGP